MEKAPFKINITGAYLKNSRYHLPEHRRKSKEGTVCMAKVFYLSHDCMLCIFIYCLVLCVFIHFSIYFMFVENEAILYLCIHKHR